MHYELSVCGSMHYELSVCGSMHYELSVCGSMHYLTNSLCEHALKQSDTTARVVNLTVVRLSQLSSVYCY